MNTFVEAILRYFKYGYLKGVENKRLDIRVIDQARGQDGLILTEFFLFFIFRFLMDRDEVEFEQNGGLRYQGFCLFVFIFMFPATPTA